MSASTGRWPVLLAGRAVRELRLLSEDKRTLEIVRTKFKELSHGQFEFTTDNYLLVRGSNEYIPIYRARLSNDLRIIYLIDLASDGQSLYDHQVIKVFSVSSRARVDYEFWVKVSKYLAKQGPDYRKRCIQRDVLDTRGGRINVPARFTHQDYVLTVADPWTTDTEVDMRELHEAVVLEKFSPVTKSLYNSILADMEAVLPMALNADERRIVRHHGTSVVIGRSGTGKTTALIYKMRANAQLGTRSENSQPTRQLFVTRSKVLTQHIASNYRGLSESSEIASKSADELEEMRKANQKYQNRELVEFDNEVDLRDDLPRQFSQLTDAHFPLFVSFDKLCDLLEADIDAEDEATVLTRSRWYKSRVITFNDFKYQYWPNFDYKLTRHLDPALVYSEILGVIKGYGHTLSKEDYVSNLSHKKSPLLSNFRNEVYKIFEAYTKQRLFNHDIDMADRTQAILAHHKLKGGPGHRVDYIFVDEVQDHLMADVYLLQSLCSNLDGGYWCGDTAQTISIGSSFRIKDLKAFIYDSMISNKDASGRQRIATPFSTFELTVNFRSHGGIVRYAASLVELIYTLFPSSIDHMQPESAKTPGDPPVFFTSFSQDLNDSEALFVSSLLDGRPVEQAPPFGAEQAIIVRSESTAKSLNSRLQKRCTVLTLRDTKGLEFDDLILYNFFAESEAPISTWRIILGLAVREDNERIQYTRSELSASISPVLCSELKQLYVAVTRARHRCWLWDSGAIVDLVRFWENLKLLTISQSLNRLSQFAESSKDLRQWSHRGQEFFSTGLYALAASCFERAGQEKEASISNAYHDMSEAKLLPAGSQQSKAAFIEAAVKMQACAMSSNRKYAAHSSTTLWYHAATCFESAKEVHRAARAYCNGGFYDRAALVCFDSKDMDACLQVWLAHGTKMDADLAQKIKEVTSVYFLRERKYNDLAKLFDGSIDRCIDFARSLKFTSQVKDLLQQTRKFRELAEVHLEDGSPAEAIYCLRQNFSDSSAVEQSRNIVSGYLWANLGIDSAPSSKSTDQATQLVEICQSPEFAHVVDRYTSYDAELFKSVLTQTNISLERLQSIRPPLDATDEESLARIILIQHHVLKTDEWVSSRSCHTFTSHLQEWRKYAANIGIIQNLESPCHHATSRRLFGLSDMTTQGAVSSCSLIQLPHGSLLQTSSHNSRVSGRSTKKNSGGHAGVASDIVDQRIRTFLTEHMKRRLLDIHPALLGSPWTQLSSRTQNNGIFDPQKSGLDDESYPSPTIDELIRSYSLIFPLLNPVKGNSVGTSAKAKTDMEKVQIRWIVRLFATIFPATGTIRDTSASFALATLETLDIMRGWIDEVLETLDPTKNKQYFVTLLIISLALASELYPDRLPTKAVPALQLKKNAQPPSGCLRRPELFTTDLYILFQRGSSGKFCKVIEAIERLLSTRASIDASVLTHLVEQVARETILSVRASAGCSEQNLQAAFSGLVAPMSWATNLVVHSKQVRHVQQSAIDKLLECMKTILARLLDNLPDCWKFVSEESRKCSVGFLAARLLWSISLVGVNLPRGHPSIPMALEAIKPAIEVGPRLHNALVKALPGTNPDWEVFSETSSQQVCLLILAQTYKHEDIVMLVDHLKLFPPAKQYFIHRVIAFKDLNDLRVTFGAPVADHTMPIAGLPVSNPKPTLLKRPSNLSLPNVVDSSGTPGAHAQPDLDVSLLPKPAPISEGDKTLEVETEDQRDDRDDEILDNEEVETSPPKPPMTLKEAVILVGTARRRALKRRQPPPLLSEFNDEGQLYEKHSQGFLKGGKKVMGNARERITWRLVRGPCLYTILGLQMLVEEIDEYVETLGQELAAPDLDPRELSEIQHSIQQRREKAKKCRDKIDACIPQASTPPLLKAKNFAGVKTQSGHAWDAFMFVKNSIRLPRDDILKEIEDLMSRGRDIVLETSKQLAKTR